MFILCRREICAAIHLVHQISERLPSNCADQKVHPDKLSLHCYNRRKQNFLTCWDRSSSEEQLVPAWLAVVRVCVSSHTCLAPGCVCKPTHVKPLEAHALAYVRPARPRPAITGGRPAARVDRPLARLFLIPVSGRTGRSLLLPLASRGARADSGSPGWAIWYRFTFLSLSYPIFAALRRT